MPFSFPGMNPYLESPRRWQEFHRRLMVAIAQLRGIWQNWEKRSLSYRQGGQHENTR